MAQRFVPKAATANHLLEGDVIYFTQPGWSRRIEDAAVALTPEDADVLLSEASVHAADAVGVVLTDVELSTGQPRPVHFREAFRTRGPSNYFHGKQAEDV